MQFIIIFLIATVFGQQITVGMRFLEDKFYGKLDTNIYYYHQVAQETPYHCQSIVYQCNFINQQNLNNYIDHTLDHEKPIIKQQIFRFLQTIEKGDKMYFKEQQRQQLDRSFEKRYYI